MFKDLVWPPNSKCPPDLGGTGRHNSIGYLKHTMRSFNMPSIIVSCMCINNFHHIPSSCIVNGIYGKRSSAHAQSMPRGGATGSKGHELILLQGAISCQAVVLSGAKRDF